MNTQIMVSVLCDVYNHEKYIRDALEGFVMQKTDFAFEVLVHDDASTDKSADIIREYEEKFPDIIKPVYQEQNQMSKGIRIGSTFQYPRIKGKYVATCEGDDYWTDPMKLQKQYDFMEKNPEYSMCGCSTAWQNQKTGTVERKGCVEEDRDFTIEELILYAHSKVFQTASIFVKADVIKEMPEWRKKFPIGDHPLRIQAGLNGKVHMMADCMCVYRYYAENSWTTRNDNDVKRAKIMKRMMEGFIALNEATNFQYDDVVSYQIKQYRYSFALMSHDLNTLLSEDLREVYMSRSLLHRLSDQLRCRSPKLYEILLKPLARRIKSYEAG